MAGVPVAKVDGIKPRIEIIIGHPEDAVLFALLVHLAEHAFVLLPLFRPVTPRPFPFETPPRVPQFDEPVLGRLRTEERIPNLAHVKDGVGVACKYNVA